MSEKIIVILVQFVTQFISTGGYAGIVALTAINSAGIPIPSEIILPFSGYLVYLGRFNLFLVATVGASAATLAPLSPIGSAPRAAVHLVERYGNGC